MKRILACMLSLAMLFTLTACGSSDTPAPAPVAAEKAEQPADPKTAAIESQKIIHAAVKEAENRMIDLYNMIDAVAFEGADAQALYDYCVQTIEDCKYYESQLETVPDLKNSEAYREAACDYIVNTHAAHISIKDYLKTGDESKYDHYLGCEEMRSTYAPLYAAERVAYLINAGLTDEEISEIIPSRKETQTQPESGAPEENQLAQITTEQKEALEAAKSYVKNMPFSYHDLIGQLEYNGFSTETATWAADHCGADWMAEAVESAKSYVSHSAFSYEDLIDQLEYAEFTHDEAVYGADNCGADWMAEAVESAESYLRSMSMSKSELESQLEYIGFTPEQIKHALTAVGY